MSIPVTGIVLIPLGLVLAALPWRYCLAGLMCFAMMSPAAVVNVGNFGLQPGYYLGLLVIGRAGAQIMTDRFTLNAFVGAQLRPLFWFIALVLAVLFVALCFFQGQVETLPGSSGFKSGMTRPFHMARENFTQLIYLILNTCLIYAMAHLGALQEPRKLLSAWDRAIIYGFVFAVGVCLWQFAGLYAGLPFPTDFFYSNAGYSRADSQSMVGLFRINGPFEEPSTLGYTFTGYLLFAWARHRIQPSAITISMITASVFCMLVSTSTTAFLGLFLFSLIILFDLTTKAQPARTKKQGFSAAYLAMIGLICAGALGAAFVLADNWAAIEIILKNTLFNKSGSTSFKQRSYADTLALQIFAQTYGAGIGLGSHKANSLLLTLLSNTGILGLMLFGTFAYARFRWKQGMHAAFTSASLRPFRLGLFGLLMVHLVSNPNLSVLTLWLALGGLLALQAAERRKSVAAGAPALPKAPVFSGGYPDIHPGPSHAPV
jgi:hypothetical protein